MIGHVKTGAENKVNSLKKTGVNELGDKNGVKGTRKLLDASCFWSVCKAAE